MEPIDPGKFSLDYLLENKVITIFSQDYVFEHGTDWDEVDIQEIIMNRLAYMRCIRYSVWISTLPAFAWQTVWGKNVIIMKENKIAVRQTALTDSFFISSSGKTL